MYDLYDRYCNVLREDRLYDEIDLVANLHRRISEAPGGWAGLGGGERVLLDHLYVDETKDFTQAEVSVY